jgi:hypothetical protein
MLIEEAKKQDIDPYIMAAIIWNESRWTPNVTDGTSCGLGQITPVYVKKTCKQLMVPETNLATMASVLRHWRNWENGGPFGNPDLHMIACYAAGTVCANSRKAVKHGRFILRLAKLYRETAEGILEKELQKEAVPENPDDSVADDADANLPKILPVLLLCDSPRVMELNQTYPCLVADRSRRYQVDRLKPLKEH